MKHPSGYGVAVPHTPRRRGGRGAPRFLAIAVATALAVSLSAAPAWSERVAPEPSPAPVTTESPKTGTPVVDEVIDAAQKEAAKTGKRVEIPDRNTESVTLYANPDGKTLRMELHSQAVRVKNADGKGFTPIDTTLVEQAGAIKPKAINGTLTLSAGQDKTLLKSQAMPGADTAKITTPSTLPKPTLKGNTARYPAAYGKGRDLLVTATATGFRQQVIISERPTGPVTFKVPVALPASLSFSKNAQGQPIIVGKDGKTLTEVRPTLLQDATAADAYAPIDTGKVGKAAVSLDGDGKTLVFTPDAMFLADPAVTYPVTMAAVAGDWWETHSGEGFGPEKAMDTFVNDKDYPDSWDNFLLDRILVGKSNSGTVRWRSYIKFLDMPAEFLGMKVENADLILWNHLSNDCGTHVGSGITTRRVMSAWDETTLNWNSQPSVTSTGQITEYAAYSPNCTSGATSWAGKEWDLVYSIDEIVQAWADGAPNYGIQLTAGNESDITNWRRYRTDEAGGCTTAPLEACKGQLHPPILTVDFEAPTPPRQETVVTTSREPLTSIPEYEEALTKSVYVPELDELIDPLSDELIAANEGQRDGGGSLIGTDKLSPKVPDPGDSNDTTNPEGEDTTPPRVLATEPASDATDVPLGSQVQATFSEEIFDPQFVVKSMQGIQIQGTTTLDDTKKIATFAPAQSLHPGTTYTVEVSGAIDAWENEMAPYTWSFRTVDQAAGRWTFDEGDGRTAADSSGNDHDAGLNDTAEWIAGKSGNAVSNVPSQARIAASEAAAKQNKTVEVADETTATSITYAQPDGKTFTTEIAAGPVRTKQNGTWVPIDTTLAEQGGVLRPKALAPGVTVDVATGGTGAFVTMTATDGKAYALSWPTALPKPAISKNVATFTDAAGKGADLVVTALATGFRHDVVLRQRPAKPLEIRIGVEAGGLTLSEGKGGRLLLESGKKLVASAPQPVMWDAPTGTSGRPVGYQKPGKITTEVVTEGGKQILVLRPDMKFLADPATKYPVTVDPTTTLPLTTDTTAVQGQTRSYAGDTYMSAGAFDGSLFGGSFHLGRSYLKFNTSALAGATVSSASLQAYRYRIDSFGSACTSSSGIIAARVAASWDPATLTWANKPATTTTGQVTTPESTNCATNQHMSWPITAIAQAWASGTANHGVELRGVKESTSAWYDVFFETAEAGTGRAPTLSVTYTLPSAPAVSGLAITPATQQSGTTVATSLTPQLAATVSDTVGGTLTGEFEVEHDPAAAGQGTGQIWAGASAAVASGGQATVSIPAGKLADGWKVRWRAKAVNAAAATASAWSNWQQATVDVPNPTVGTFQVTPSQVVNGVTVTTSVTPTLHTTVTDPAAQPLRAEVEVEHDPTAPAGQGSGQIWAGSVDNVASGTQANLAVPANTLTDGWKVRWRARAVNTATTVGSPWSDWQALTVDVPDPVSEPAVGALQVNPSAQVDGITVTPTRTPALLAQVSDPAGGALRAEVEVEHDPAATGQGTGQIWTGSADNVPAGTQATITVPADTLADGWKVRWRARAVSATAASAWSDWQSFTVSLPKPAATGLTITPSKVVDGVTVTTTLTPAVQATVTHPTGQGLRAEAEIEHDPAAPAAQGTGPIWTGAVDNVASGTQASIAVPAGTLADGWKVRWRLRAVAGDVSSAWSDWQQVTVDVTQPGEEPLAQTTGPVIRTDQSFTATAWLRWSDKEGNYTVAEQKGTHQAPFRLGNTAEHGLVFTFTNADATDATVEGVLSGVEPPVDEWFHLAGVYDAATRTATLYLNGAQAGTAQLSFPAWNAQAPLRIGAAMAGSIDEVAIYQRPFSADEVASVIASVTAPAPVAARALQKTASTQAVAETGDFDYDRINLQTCQVSGSETGHGEYDARIRELPYNSCWSSYLQVNDYVEDESTGRLVKASCKSLFKNPVLKWACKQVAEPFDEDLALRFRATVVIHSYLGNATGTGVVDGAGTGIKPTDMKMFIQLDDFALIGEDGRVVKPGNQLSDLPITTRLYIPDPPLTDEGCTTGDGEKRRISLPGTPARSIPSTFERPLIIRA